MTDRFVAWEGCVNARDLGGLPLRDGGQTRFGAVFRADNMRHLTPRGWRTAQEQGVRTVVDLRFDRERAEDPPPAGIAVVGISLFGDEDANDADRIDDLMRAEPDTPRAVAVFYLDTLETCAPRIAQTIGAVAEAPEGAVAVHCFVGKDRTGIVAALLLELAGVEHEAIVADYALSEGRVGSLVDGWIADAADESERRFRERISTAPAQAMDTTLRGLQERHGGARRYLLDAGVEQGTLDRAAARLR